MSGAREQNFSWSRNRTVLRWISMGSENLGGSDRVLKGRGCRGLDLQEGEDHISVQVTSSTSSLSARFSSTHSHLEAGRPTRDGTEPDREQRDPCSGLRRAAWRDAGLGEDGGTRGSGLERILQRGGLCRSTLSEPKPEAQLLRLN